LRLRNSKQLSDFFLRYYSNPDSSGVSRTATTNSSGYFLFTDVAAGASYTFEARAKNYNFTGSAQIFNVTEEIDDIKLAGAGRR
jgi:hypothetical protein